MKHISFIVFVTVLCLVTGCTSITPANSLHQVEVVMTPGMRITANTPAGSMTITAGEGLVRSYTWEGSTRSVEMVPRAERWHGSLGLYYPGPGEHWKEHHGIARGVVEEGQQHFQTVDEAMKWIQSRKWMPYVYTDNGLIVGWRKVPSRKQLNVEVWQILIAGKKPNHLPGSQNSKIGISGTGISGISRTRD